MKRDLPVWRSLLYVPVNVERFVEKAHTRGADVIHPDLEDAVPPAEKERARTLVEGNAARGEAHPALRGDQVARGETPRPRPVTPCAQERIMRPSPLPASTSACLAALAALLLGAFSLPASAADGAKEYPSRPIRIIAQFTPGTSTDILARVVAQKMTESWGQQVIVDNRPGAGAVIGTLAARNATPDGYTLVMAVSSAFGINPTLYSKLPYDAIRDFAPISNLGLTPQTLVAGPSAPMKSVKEFVAAAKEKPGQINYASLGSGSTSHLTMEMFRAAAGVRLNHIPFKGSAEAHAQVIGGQIPVMFDAIPATLPHVKSGKLRGLGIATLKRSPFLPELPTIAESGYPGFEAVGWIGIAAPARTPAPVLDKLNAEMVRILNQPDVKERLATLAFTPAAGTRDEFAAFIKSEIAKWGKAVKESGAKAD
jgi:tripartite-type tricarboxylate transporter receptor subunit TctC